MLLLYTHSFIHSFGTDLHIDGSVRRCAADPDGCADIQRVSGNRDRRSVSLRRRQPVQTAGENTAVVHPVNTHSHFNTGMRNDKMIYINIYVYIYCVFL